MAKRRTRSQPGPLSRLHIIPRFPRKNTTPNSNTSLTCYILASIFLAVMTSVQTLLKTCETQRMTSNFQVDTVPLHNLCLNCKRFCQEWETLDWSHRPLGQRTVNWPYATFLCTVEQLGYSQNCCHFCKLLATSLERWPFAKRKNLMGMSVYLHPRDERKEHLVVIAMYAKATPKNEDGSKQFATFALERFSGTHIPVQQRTMQKADQTRNWRLQGAFCSSAGPPSVPGQLGSGKGLDRYLSCSAHRLSSLS